MKLTKEDIQKYGSQKEINFLKEIKFGGAFRNPRSPKNPEIRERIKELVDYAQKMTNKFMRKKSKRMREYIRYNLGEVMELSKRSLVDFRAYGRDETMWEDVVKEIEEKVKTLIWNINADFTGEKTWEGGEFYDLETPYLISPEESMADIGLDFLDQD